MEIERKYLVHKLPENIGSFPCVKIEQAYLCVSPVIRIRQKDEAYILTYKSSGLLARQEVEVPLTKEAYGHLKEKADGTVISKTRYIIPLSGGLNIELDIFWGGLSGFVLAEVEFPSLEEANQFAAPAWFGDDVTFDPAFHNSTLSAMGRKEREDFINGLKTRGFYHKI